jgi:FXSXX-COOH protein
MQDGDLLAVPDLVSLEGLAAQPDSVLAEAIRRLQRSTRGSDAGVTAHNSTEHNSSHNSSPW